MDISSGSDEEWSPNEFDTDCDSSSDDKTVLSARSKRRRPPKNLLKEHISYDLAEPSTSKEPAAPGDIIVPASNTHAIIIPPSDHSDGENENISRGRKRPRNFENW
nr:uncharacterized protein LOC111505413 [Leptinotarsa decemlineata]